MATPDDYESTDDTTPPPSDTTGQAVKHYQIAVPEFQDVAPAASVPTQYYPPESATSASIETYTGTSFMRIGSSPTTDEWTTAPFAESYALAKLVADPAAIMAAEGLRVTNGAISAGQWETANASTGPSPAAASATLETGASDPGAATFSDSFTDGSGVTGPYGYVGDSNYLLGFADDTRYRGKPDDGTGKVNGSAPETLVNGQPAANINVNRQAETLRLLTKGGWWDHSGGNRITTTAGDKIEVIQGNYKMVVLGRQDPTVAPGTLSANAFITDVSGGHFQEQYPSPTPCIKTVEYVQDESGEWTLYQDNGKGNLITKLHGRTVDMFQGSKRESYVGFDPDNFVPSTPDTGSVIGNALEAAVGITAVSEWGQKAFQTPDLVNDPVIISKTWAQSIETYTGGVNKPVPHIHSYTYADEIQNYTFAASHVNTTMGASAVSISGVANTLEVVMGLKESIQVGASVTLKFASDLTVGVTRASFHGTSTSFDGGKAVATVTEEKLTGVETAIAETSSKLSTTTDDINVAHTRIADAIVAIANGEAHLAEEILMGA